MRSQPEKKGADKTIFPTPQPQSKNTSPSACKSTSSLIKVHTRSSASVVIVPQACAPFFHSVNHKPVSIAFHKTEKRALFVRAEGAEEDDDAYDNDDDDVDKADPRGVRPVVK